MSIVCNALTPLLRFVVDFSYNLFLYSCATGDKIPTDNESRASVCGRGASFLLPLLLPLLRVDSLLVLAYLVPKPSLIPVAFHGALSRRPLFSNWLINCTHSGSHLFTAARAPGNRNRPFVAAKNTAVFNWYPASLGLLSAVWHNERSIALSWIRFFQPRDAMLARYCSLIPCYPAKKNWKRRVSFESKVLNCNSLLYYFNTCPKLW